MSDEPDGWIWRTKPTSGRWVFRGSLDGRGYPATAEFVPVRFLAPVVDPPASPWKAIADALAARLANHAFCEDHPNEGDADPRNCPFCHDIAALQAYRRAVNQEQ